MTGFSISVPDSEVEQKRFNKDGGIIVMMDGGGSNATMISEHFLVPMIVTSRTYEQGSRAYDRARDIGHKQGTGTIPVAEFDFAEYEDMYGVKKGDYLKALQARELQRQIDNADSSTDPQVHINTFMLNERLKKIKSDKSIDEIIQIREDCCKYLLDFASRTMAQEGISPQTPAFGAGFFALTSDEFNDALYTITVHPGDLTQYATNGIFRSARTVVGDGWLPSARAISAGHENLYSSMFITEGDMDTGRIVMRGYPLNIDYNWLLPRIDLTDKKALKTVGEAAQETLKDIGDHVIAGATFHDLFEGNIGIHKSGALAYRSTDVCVKNPQLEMWTDKWYLAPNGVKIEDHITNNPNTPFCRDEGFIAEKVQRFYDDISRLR